MRERALSGGAPENRRARRRMGADGSHVDQADRALGHRSDGIAALHRSRRSERGRSDGDERCPAPADRTRRHGDDRGGLDVTRAAHRRPHRRDRQLLLHRPVVSEARRPRGRGMELPSVSRRDGVLLGLRRLRRLADGSRGLDGRRHRRRARTARQRQRHHHAPVLSRGRPRLRVDDEPRLSRTDGAVRAPDAACSRDAAAAAARARQPGGASFRRDAHHAQVLRRMVRRLSLRPHHDRRSRVAERRRRHGVSRRCSPPGRDGSRPQASRLPRR